MKKLLYLYERAMWYAGIAIGELDKPLTMLKYASYAAILVKVFGFSISLWWIAWGYLIAMAGAVFVGIVLIKTGIISYIQGLNNSQNPELLEILEKLDGLIDGK